MVAVMEDLDGEERPLHQGCMAGFLHLFDRPQILSGRRLHHAPRRLLSSSSGSATPSERSMQLGQATPAPSSPDATPPAAPRPSLQLPPLDLKDGGASSGVSAAPSWRLPRLSLDSRAVVDGQGKYRPREIPTPSPAAAPPSPGMDDRRSPSVVARLMGLDALPYHGEGGDSAATAGELRRSASERVPRGADPSRFRFVDPAFFERPASPQPREQRPPSIETAARRAADVTAGPGPRGVAGVVQRRSRFDAREVFPEPAAGHGGEIALYGEIERRLRKRGIAEPARDLETLKQVLEALQLKGLLRHQAPPPPPAAAPVRTPPPIVVMRPAHRSSPPPPAARLTPARRLRVDVDRTARRPRSPDPSASPARSPASPARRGPQSPQRRGVSSPAAQSPKQQHQQQTFRKQQPTSSFDAAGAPARIARRAAQNNGLLLFPDEEASTTFSDGGSSGGSFGASSRWDFDPPMLVHGDETSRKLERCGKLLSSIHAFTGGDAAAASDQQPSPVSVLDAAAFLADEDSPSSSSGGSKRAIDFNIIRSPRTSKPATTAAAVSEDTEEDDDWALGPWPTTEAVGDPDYAYVAELVRLFLGRKRRDPADVYKVAEQRWLHRGGDACHHRRLLCGAVAEALDAQRAACPWDPAAWLCGAELVGHVWAEVRRAREPVSAPAAEDAELDLNDVTCGAIRRDLMGTDGAWASSTLQQQPRRLGPEVADAVLQVERLVFKDLVADTIRELADADSLVPPRRKLVF
ncbi:hypothetical protein QOZ80_9AG0683910 [Eleusine coracana subsp. coracana]|nr:hypothetical protein QOZ80_9AG0683910 [Eleusine coracana subsp. coracana]